MEYLRVIDFLSLFLEYKEESLEDVLFVLFAIIY